MRDSREGKLEAPRLLFSLISVAHLLQGKVYAMTKITGDRSQLAERNGELLKAEQTRAVCSADVQLENILQPKNDRFLRATLEANIAFRLNVSGREGSRQVGRVLEVF